MNSLSGKTQKELEERLKYVLNAGYRHALGDVYFRYITDGKSGVMSWLDNEWRRQGWTRRHENPPDSDQEPAA